MLPIALNLRNRRVLIVGGGAVAARKAAACLEAGADVTVVAPGLVESFPPLVEHQLRLYQSGDCAGYDLVFAATNSGSVNGQIAAEARSNKIWCNIADDPDASDFHTQSLVRQGQIAIGISTQRLSPTLARHLRERVESVVGPEYQLLQELTRELDVPLPERAAFWRAVLDSDVLQLLRSGETARARNLLGELFAQA